MAPNFPNNQDFYRLTIRLFQKKSSLEITGRDTRPHESGTDAKGHQADVISCTRVGSLRPLAFLNVLVF